MFLILAAVSLVAAFLYLRHIERGLQAWPRDAQKLAPHRWFDTDIKSAADRVSRQRLDWTPLLPPKLERRYIIVGGSGLIGGHIALQLLARGQSPESIRIVDFSKTPRREFQAGQSAAKIEFVQADIRSSDSIRAAFNKPWPKSVANLPLTAFHTAAIIRPGDRKKILYSELSQVNVVGCANTLSAAKAAGADVFISTSSGSIAIRPLKLWFYPWQKYPVNMVQVYPDPDKDQNIRPSNQYYGTYPETKARAEDLTLKANTASFQTGCIRPACGVYGNEFDWTIGAYMRAGQVPS
jgi:nucleoside-diphosphate-sugar epimerase